MLMEFVKHSGNNLLTVSLQSKQMRCHTPLNQAAAMLKVSGQSDPDLQRYLRQTHTHTHTHTHRFGFAHVFVVLVVESNFALLKKLVCVLEKDLINTVDDN